MADIYDFKFYDYDMTSCSCRNISLLEGHDTVALEEGLVLRLPRLDVITHRAIATTVPNSAGEKWRLQHGKARCGNEYGPLTDLPDWSYVDGRPAPLNRGQVRRIEERKQLAEQIREGISDLQFAIANHEYRTKKQQDERQAIKDSKFKPKRRSNKNTRT